MTHGPEYLKEQARKASARLLRQAATYVESLAPKPLFKKRMGKGAISHLVQVDSFGVISVIDSETGEVKAISVQGKHSVLSPDFVPVVSALTGTQGDRN